MTLQQFEKTYLITDSEVVVVHLDYGVVGPTVTIKLKIRKALPKNKWEIVCVSLFFEEASEFYFYDSFDCRSVSQSTLLKTESGHYYLSLDPYEEGRISEQDNMVVRSKMLHLLDEDGQRHELS